MRTIAIIQARMGSSRLPGKVLMDLCGDTMLARVVARARAAQRIADVVIATSLDPGDDAIAVEAARLGVGCHRGSEHDVLARFTGAAEAAHADAIVRLTADCPLLDPRVIDAVVAALAPDIDYASNTHDRTYPRGLDAEALHRDTLARLDRMATTPSTREHVTSYVMEHPTLFRIRQVCADDADDADLRWTVDTADDLALVRMLYMLLDLAGAHRPYREVVAAVRARPVLTAVNAHVPQKPWRGPHVG